MDTQTPNTPNCDPISQIDASRPFRSVKEAITIFGDRLFFKGVQSSPKCPNFEVENKASFTSDLTQNHDKLINFVGEQDVGSSFNRPSDLPEITLGPTEALTIASKEVVESPMYEPTPSPEKAQQESLIQSPNKPTNPFGEQEVGSSLDEPPYPSKMTLGPTEPLSVPSKQVVESPMYGPTPSLGNPKKESRGNIVHGNDLVMMMMVLQKLEAELQETKTELKLLKERGLETEVALASLNAELHKNMSKMAKAEANEAGKAATKSTTSSNEGRNREMETREGERTKSDIMVKTIDSPTLAQILSISDYEGYFRENKLRMRKSMKKKPIIPLVTDLFIWKKKASPTLGISEEPVFSKMYFT